MRTVRDVLVACALCAVALLSAPRIAHAQVLEMDFPMYGSVTFPSTYDTPSTFPWRTNLISSDPNSFNILSFQSGTEISYPVSSTSASSAYNTYLYGHNIENVGAYVASSYKTASGNSSLDMSKHISVSIVWTCYQFGSSGTPVMFSYPQYPMFFYLPTILSNNNDVVGYSVLGSSKTTFWCLPHGQTNNVTNWVRLNRSSDGYFYLPSSVDAIGMSVVTSDTFQSSPISFSSMSHLERLFFGYSSLPLLYVNFPNLSDAATSQDVSNAVTSINGRINQQTNQLMSTAGSGDILSGQVQSVGDSLESGVFGQLSGVMDDFTGILSETTINGGVDFPGINVLGYQLVAPRTVYVWQNGLLQYAPYIRGACTFVLFCAWFNGMVYVFQHQILGIDLIQGAEVYSDVATGGMGTRYHRLGGRK